MNDRSVDIHKHLCLGQFRNRLAELLCRRTRRLFDSPKHQQNLRSMVYDLDEFVVS